MFIIYVMTKKKMAAKVERDSPVSCPGHYF